MFTVLWVVTSVSMTVSHRVMCVHGPRCPSPTYFFMVFPLVLPFPECHRPGSILWNANRLPLSNMYRMCCCVFCGWWLIQGSSARTLTPSESCLPSLSQQKATHGPSGAIPTLLGA